MQGCTGVCPAIGPRALPFGSPVMDAYMTDSSSLSRRFLVAIFTEEEDILSATRAATDANHPVYDAFTPYAVHGLDTAQKLPRSRITWIAFFGGVCGFLTATFLQVYTQGVTTSALSGWPLIIGGKPFLPFPAFVPVWFELTVLFAGLSAALGMFAVNGLYPGKKARLLIDGVTNDRFALAFDPQGRGFDEPTIRALMAQHHVAEIAWVDEAPASTGGARKLLTRAGLTLAVLLVVIAGAWVALNAPHHEAEVAAPAPAAKPIVLLTEAELAGVNTDAALVVAGEAKFRANCVVCHGEKAEGKVGPNLTDKFWLHGNGSLADIYATIAKGVLEKGMPSWALTLQAADLKALTAYVGSLRGRNVPGKEPQGNPVELPAAASPAAAATPAAP